MLNKAEHTVHTQQTCSPRLAASLGGPPSVVFTYALILAVARKGRARKHDPTLMLERALNGARSCKKKKRRIRYARTGLLRASWL
eukprot:587828-Prymnesium_polylepis.1